MAQKLVRCIGAACTRQLDGVQIRIASLNRLERLWPSLESRNYHIAHFRNRFSNPSTWQSHAQLNRKLDGYPGSAGFLAIDPPRQNRASGDCIACAMPNR